MRSCSPRLLVLHRTAPHGTAWHGSAQPPRTRTGPPPITTSAGDAAPITLLEARPHHRSHGLGARGTAWRVASLAWGSSARGTGKRAHDARDATRKSGNGGAGAGGGSSGQGAEFAARKVCTACLHGLPCLTGGCCVVESADSARREDPWVCQDRGRGGAEEGVGKLVMRDRETG